MSSAATLIHSPLVSHYLRFVSTTVGRDKALRTLQYFARFFSWYLLRKGYTSTTIAPWNAIKSNFGTIRKAMRLGKNIEHLKAASMALDSTKTDAIGAYLAAGRQLGYFGYLTLDNLVFLSSAGIYPLQSAKRLTREAQRFWLIGLIFSLVQGVYTLRKLSEAEVGVVKTEAEGRLKGEKIARERSAVKTQIVSDVADFVIPASGMGLVGVDEGVVGFAGLVSSVIGLKAAWKKTA